MNGKDENEGVATDSSDSDDIDDDDAGGDYGDEMEALLRKRLAV